MDSEVADLHDNGEQERLPLDSSADQSNSSADSFNGDLHHHLPLPDLLASKHGDLSAEIEKSIADNQVLVDQIASLRDARAAMEHTQQLLQRELLGSAGKAEALSSEIASLEVEKRKHKDLAACMAQEVRTLHKEKTNLQAENGNTASETKSLDAMLTETKEKSSLLATEVDEKQVAVAAAQTSVHMICFEVEKLQLEKEEYSNEVSLLKASNGTIDSQISQLREEEKALSNEVDQTVAAKSLAEQEVSNAQANIAALSVQVSTLTESNEDMQNKLCGAKERLKHLEEKDKAMALKEREMETCILDLESTVHTSKANFDIAEQALEQENLENSRALEVMHMKVAENERDLHVLDLHKQQCVQDLQCRVSDLCEEKEALARSNEELQAELRKTHEKPEAEKYISLKEDIKRLEGTLNEAEERARLSASKEIELKCKLQELTIHAKSKPMLASLATPLVISGGTIVALGMLVYLLRSNSRSK